MKSLVSDDFVECFTKLPDAVKTQAHKNYRLWRENSSHPSLHFKRIHGHDDIYAVRVGIGWRAVGLHQEDALYWFWIGSHAEYDKLLKQL